MAQASFSLFANCMWYGRLPPQISIIHFILLKLPRGNGWCIIPLDIVPELLEQGPGTVLSSAVHFEIGARERPIPPSLRNATGTNSSLKILQSGSASQEIKQVSRHRIHSVSPLKSRGSNQQVDIVRSPVSKFRPRQISIVTFTPASQNRTYSPLPDQSIEANESCGFEKAVEQRKNFIHKEIESKI
ncbi:hypothetical protein EAF00_000515 [Botryotinia globosa]|nr:hypothetical protein EAF00_000515 [Botryotinia globosa]